MRSFDVKRLVMTAILLSLALILGYIESLLPPIIISMPFIRIGLSNIILLYSLIALGAPSAYTIGILKSILVPLFIGNPMMILYSLPACTISLSISLLLTYLFRLGLVTVSVMSSICHNLTQIIVAFILTASIAVLTFIPYLLVLSLISGALVGTIVHYLIKYLPRAS